MISNGCYSTCSDHICLVMGVYYLPVKIKVVMVVFSTFMPASPTLFKASLGLRCDWSRRVENDF